MGGSLPLCVRLRGGFGFTVGRVYMAPPDDRRLRQEKGDLLIEQCGQEGPISPGKARTNASTKRVEQSVSRLGKRRTDAS
jgi:hypothetical protein